MNRQEVYTIVDGERDYQDSLPPSRTDGREHTVGEFLVMLQHYLNQAVEAWTLNPGDGAALDNVRKCAGICVKCMEVHGAPRRKER
jgi:hypothetical protein